MKVQPVFENDTLKLNNSNINRISHNKITLNPKTKLLKQFVVIQVPIKPLMYIHALTIHMCIIRIVWCSMVLTPFITLHVNL